MRRPVYLSFKTNDDPEPVKGNTSGHQHTMPNPGPPLTEPVSSVSSQKTGNQARKNATL